MFVQMLRKHHRLLRIHFHAWVIEQNLLRFLLGKIVLGGKFLNDFVWADNKVDTHKKSISLLVILGLWVCQRLDNG